MTLALPEDYAERVYAGVLGKVIGVYLGRPFEGWSYERIQKQLGDITYYVHDQLNVPLIVTDDDISGTFTFLRALNDHGVTADISAQQIGQSWLNYIIENRSILWWGGLGNSTEHTAYLRLKQGIKAPNSGAAELNGKVVSEQIGAQIFIDGWAMVAPGQPDLAARLAEQAARVSHDGEAVNGAIMLAVMESMAFVEQDSNALIDAALNYIPNDSLIRQLIEDIRSWHAKEKDWRASREKLSAVYGYDKYGGNCHIVPNHGLIIHALLYGDDDFSETMKIVNTSGWDTDCNAGNLGCLMGIKEGLAGIDNSPVDWRGPFADKIYLPSAEGGRGISDCAAEAVAIIQLGQQLNGKAPWRPKQGAQFHFSFQGSVQGFTIDPLAGQLQNIVHPLQAEDRALKITANKPALCGTPTFAPSKEIAKYFETRGYALMTCPRLYSGQTIYATVYANEPVRASLYIKTYGENDLPAIHTGDIVEVNHLKELRFDLPECSDPIFEVGINLPEGGLVYLSSLGWHGEPNIMLTRPDHRGTMWRRAWVDASDSFSSWGEPFRIISNEDTGLIMQGTREWCDYAVTADITPHLAKRVGIAARVQGLKRYYALILDRDGYILLTKMLDQETELAKLPFNWNFGETFVMSLAVKDNLIVAEVNGEELLRATDDELQNGGIGLLVTEGRSATQQVKVEPLAAAKN